LKFTGGYWFICVTGWIKEYKNFTF
jgi:hypothetical protein